MNMKKLLLVPFFIIVLFSCRDPEVDPPERTVHEWIFDEDAQGWEGDFADYPVGVEEFYELEYSHTRLPAPLDTTRGALMLSGSNRSDDLFMYIKRRITNLLPETVYHITFHVEFASNVADGMAGIGGSPGESVYVKAGAAAGEPDRIIDDMDYYRMNIDIGNQSQDGSDMVVIGDFSNNTDQEVYTIKAVANDNQAFSVLSSDTGELWIIVGTDSGFEGTTTIYYSNIRVELVR